jgi:hypothetical protein
MVSRQPRVLGGGDRCSVVWTGENWRSTLACKLAQWESLRVGFEEFDIFDETKRKLESEGWAVTLVERMQPPGDQYLVIATNDEKGQRVEGFGETPVEAIMQVWGALHPHDAFAS